MLTCLCGFAQSIMAWDLCWTIVQLMAPQEVDRWGVSRPLICAPSTVPK